MDWNNVLSQVVDILYAVILGLVPVAVLVIRAYAKKWLDVKLSDQQSWMLENLTAQAVNYAEEQASKLIKEGVDKPSRKTKLDYAFDYLVSHARDARLPELGTEIVREKIEAHLGSEHKYQRHMREENIDED